MIARISYTSPTNAEVLSESGHEASEEKGPHCVPHSAKGEEGQPVPEKAPGPPRCLLLIKYNAPLPSQDSRGSRWPGPLPLQTLQSSLPFPAHRSSPAAGAPDCIALWGAALASACLATSSGWQDYFLLPQLPLNMSVGVFQPIFNQR